MSRAEVIDAKRTQLVADVTFYETANGGRLSAAFPGWGCPCTVSQKEPWVGYDGWPQMRGEPINPGEQRRLGFVFLTEEGAEVMKTAGKFYLWEGRFIGEAVVLDSNRSLDSTRS